MTEHELLIPSCCLTNTMDEWEALVKGRKWKAGRLNAWSWMLSSCLMLCVALLSFWMTTLVGRNILSPQTMTSKLLLAIKQWFSLKKEQCVGVVSGKKKRFLLNSKNRQWTGRGHLPADVQSQSKPSGTEQWCAALVRDAPQLLELWIRLSGTLLVVLC